jgi:hypothetical protein
MTLKNVLRLIFFFFSHIREVDIRLKEQEHDRSIVELKVSCTKILPSDLLHQSVSINIIVICFAKSIIKFLLSLFQEQHILLHVFFPDYHTLNLPLQFWFPSYNAQGRVAVASTARLLCC